MGTLNQAMTALHLLLPVDWIDSLYRSERRQKLECFAYVVPHA